MARQLLWTDERTLRLRDVRPVSQRSEYVPKMCSMGKQRLDENDGGAV